MVHADLQPNLTPLLKVSACYFLSCTYGPDTCLGSNGLLNVQIADYALVDTCLLQAYSAA